jgi:hypothetical protein
MMTENDALNGAKESKMDGEDTFQAPVEMNHSVPSTTTSPYPSPRPPSSTAVVVPPSSQTGAVPPLELGWTKLGKRPAPSTLGSSSPSHSKTARSDADAALSGSNDTETQKNDAAGASIEPNPKEATDNRGEADEDDDDDDFWLWNESSSCWSCSDPSCARRREEMSNGNNGAGVVFQRRRAGTGTGGQQPNAQMLRAVRGQAVWLLPTASASEVDWFQGYLLPPPSTSQGSAAEYNSKPWGLLAQQVDIDECLACADGGYRRVSITLYDWNGVGAGPLHEQPSHGQRRTKHKLGEADWTGGDMMKLLGSNVRMKPTQLLTGRAAVPFVTSLFSSLWKRIVADHQQALCNEEYDDEENHPPAHEVLDLLPDVAIVLGDMEVILPAGPEETR